GDTFLGMDLSQGGHLTHGSPVNFSGLLYKAVSYGLTDEGYIDYDAMRRQAREHRPQLIIARDSAYPRGIAVAALAEVSAASGADYTRQIIANAKALAAALMRRGYQLVSGGTDNHLMLIDLRNKGLTGKVAETALNNAGITVNKNTVPKETQSPFVTSGIRVG